MMKYGRKFAVAVLGMFCVTLIGVLNIHEVGEVALAIAGIVGTFNGAHAIQDHANAKAGKPAG